MSRIGSVVESARRSAAQSVTRLRNVAGLQSVEPQDMKHDVQDETPLAANEDAAPARPDPSVLSANTEMKGSIATSDELYIQGRLEGDVRATSIIVCHGGIVLGDIAAESVTVYGTVTGNIDGGDVLLCAGAVVDGEITHRSLGIDTGANFEGSIRRRAEPSALG